MNRPISFRVSVFFLLALMGSIPVFGSPSERDSISSPLAKNIAYPEPPAKTIESTPVKPQPVPRPYPEPIFPAPEPTIVPIETSEISIVWKSGLVSPLKHSIEDSVAVDPVNPFPEIDTSKGGDINQNPRDEDTQIGDVSPQAIIVNNRVIVQNTTVMPHLWVVNLDVKYPNGASGFCSGWLHSERGISTAGHCVYSPERGGWATEILVTPGRNGPNPPFPFRTCRAYDLWTNNFWLGIAGTPAQRPYNDWGGVLADCSYRKLGHFGYEVSIPANNQQAIVSGYPCEGIQPQNLGKQFTSTGVVLGVESFWLGRSRIVKVNSDAVGCNSGSPIYQSNGSVFGTITQANSDANRGTLISPEYSDALTTAGNRTLVYLPLMRRP